MTAATTSVEHADADRWNTFLDRYLKDRLVAAAVESAPLRIDYDEVYQFDPEFAHECVEQPNEVLSVLDSTIDEYTIDAAPDATIDNKPELVNVPDQPIVSELRERHLDRYCGVRGQVSLASQVEPQLERAAFECQRCGHHTTIDQFGSDVSTPHQCEACERKGPFVVDESRSQRRDHQRIEVIDPPGENPQTTGDSVTAHLYDDMAGSVDPGERVCLYGIVQTEPIDTSDRGSVSRRQPWRINPRAIDREAKAFDEMQPDRLEEITALSNRDDIINQFIHSIAPDILTGDRGDKHKLALVLALFGGASETDRDDINIFFVGAPGTGKSAYLQRASEIAPKAVQASGKGATAAGLTASATRSEADGRWMLDPGALVLANGGVACIDEFDKMDDSARKSMHEAMEDQQVPINKAGINAVLPTETTVIAAANPVGGSFDRFEALNEQVDLDSPILSRFDLIFGVSDGVDADRDRAIAEHQHKRSAGDGSVEPPLDDELMTQYIAYARQTVDPEYDGDAALERLSEYYVQRRQESSTDDLTPITPRVNDALRRLAQASARMHLRETITEHDADLAIELMDRTLGDTALDEEGNLDGGKSEGRNLTQDDRRKRVKTLVGQLGSDGDPAPQQDVIDEMRTIGADPDMVRQDLEHWLQKGEIMQPKQNVYRRVE